MNAVGVFGTYFENTGPSAVITPTHQELDCNPSADESVMQPLVMTRLGLMAVFSDYLKTVFLQATKVKIDKFDYINI